MDWLSDIIGASSVSPNTEPIASSRLLILPIVFSKVLLFRVSRPNNVESESNSKLTLLNSKTAVFFSSTNLVSNFSNFSNSTLYPSFNWLFSWISFLRLIIFSLSNLNLFLSSYMLKLANWFCVT